MFLTIYLEASLLLAYFKLLLLVLFLFISGCFQVFPCGRFQLASCKSEVSPNELPNAIVGKPYSQKIEIKGGTMIDENNIKWELITESTWLNIRRFKDDVMHYNGMPIYRGIEVYGIPSTQKDVIFKIHGKSSQPCVCSFDQEFTIKINPEK